MTAAGGCVACGAGAGVAGRAAAGGVKRGAAATGGVVTRGAWVAAGAVAAVCGSACTPGGGLRRTGVPRPDAPGSDGAIWAGAVAVCGATGRLCN